MYLKSIEIQGFKSFANKIVFRFHNGITGIVGPNGSGKSNVADAVRWVLGEQRIKQLRGASMQDVIFAGTELRKPLSYAYVAITLDNADRQLPIDYEEVTVARRIYRSGESEYSINGSLCRLKDVNELFYDTGIGKEGYSIIGQGQIDRILSGKPEERRELFDEAAGIVKFKKRKATAQKKLEDEKNNLIRVNDILGELEKQLGPLEKQAEKARVFVKKRNQLEKLDVNLFLVENESKTGQLTEVEEKLRIANGELEETQERYAFSKEEYDRIQGEIERLDEEIETGRKELSDTSLVRERLNGQIKVLKEQINSASANEGHLNHRKETISAQIAEKQKNIDEISGKKQEMDLQVQELEKKRQNAKDQLKKVQDQIAESNDQIEVWKSEIMKMLADRNKLQDDKTRFDMLLEQQKTRRAELNSRFLQAKSDEVEQKELIENYRQEFQNLTGELELLKKERIETEQRIAGCKNQLIAKDQEYRLKQQQFHEDKSKLETLTNLAERYEGYGSSVKRVMEQKEQNKGIVGVVADIISVEKKYETAIETALGGSIQNIVTEDEETAKRMIGFLKKVKGGRATFLPLTSIKDPQEFKTPEALKEEGVIGLADSLIQIDHKYKDVTKSLVGRIMVVDTVDHAFLIARKYHYGIRMVTLEGELLVPGGAISGGAFKNNSNLLGRRRELEELEGKLKKDQEEVEEKNREIAEIKNLRNDYRRRVEEIRLEVETKSLHQNTARLNVEAAQEKWDQTKAGYSDLQTEQKTMEEELKRIQSDVTQSALEMEKSKQKEEEIKLQVEKVQQTLSGMRRIESEKIREMTDFDVEVEKYKQQQSFIQQNLDRVRGEIMNYDGELQEVEDQLHADQSEVERKKQQILETEETIRSSHQVQGDMEKKLEEDVENKAALSERQKTIFANRDELQGRINDLGKETTRLANQQENLVASIDGKINYMWEEYEITLSDAASMRDEELTDISGMKKEITALKDQIRKLGDVNVNAIEELRELTERYTFLKTQHDDLIDAEKRLQEIIQELDTAMRKQFKDKFQEIATEFDKVFKEMFGGGKGTLELVEEEDILEAGIRVIAQPPGKKLQNMMQLSGGEKALSAIALLFAIQNLKPSPFCLLDEIEAALDESNVGRYAGYLHKLTKHTQFIVITHRRGTMERADRLYGITMQEKGVSTLVSVSLIDGELDN